MFRKLLFIFVCSIPALPGSAGTQLFGVAETEAMWQSESSRLACRIKQTIPYYGYVAFERLAGHDLAMAIHVDREPIARGTAQFSAVPPPWMPTAEVKELGTLEFSKGEMPFRYNREVALRTMAELENGLFPTLNYRDWGDGGDDVTVTVSAVKFRPVVQEFLSCMDDLVPVTYDQIKNASVYFESGSSRLTQSSKNTLDYITEYLKAEPDEEVILAVSVDGHTDFVGTEIKNLLLSERRAETVKRYLSQKGANEAKLQTNYYGERKPATSNMTAKGRSKNRRVTIRLFD